MISFDTYFFIEVLKYLPHWLIGIIVILLVIKYLCGNNIKMLIRIIGKHNAREEKKDREQDNRLTTIESVQQNTIKQIQRNTEDIFIIKTDVNSILELLTKGG